MVASTSAKFLSLRFESVWKKTVHRVSTRSVAVACRARISSGRLVVCRMSHMFVWNLTRMYACWKGMEFGKPSSLRRSSRLIELNPP